MDPASRRKEARTVIAASYLGSTPVIVAQIFKDSGGNTNSVVLYLAAMSVIAILFILLTRDPKQRPPDRTALTSPDHL
ncbi:hypothetical protein M1D93_00940 [Arthrobacter sp. Z1-9]